MADTKVEDEATEAAKKKQSNDERRANALMLKLQKAHDWRVQVWAQCELRIRAMNDELVHLGVPPFEPYETDLDDDSSLRHYSEMKLG